LKIYTLFANFHSLVIYFLLGWSTFKIWAEVGITEVELVIIEVSEEEEASDRKSEIGQATSYPQHSFTS
jgi:hypothetical protein